jgi:predicted metal-dependent enzyme (double-stranded beta helix superfamily)
MATVSNQASVQELIRMLDAAVDTEDDCKRCRNVKDVLHEVVLSQKDFISEEFLKPAPDKYARRLLHRDPKGKYTVLVMVWGEGQGTALHDHAGMWCCECVYRGRIKVVSYSCRSEEEGVFRFEREKEVMASIADAGALIPPFDYHTIENPDATPSVTIHVYGGEMTWCHAFEPVDGGYRMVRRELGYTGE